MIKRFRSRASSRVGDDLVEAFNDMARYLRGEIKVEYYEIEDPPIKTEGLDTAIGRKSSIKKA